VTRDAQSQQNDVEVGFAGKRLRTTDAHRIERDMHQAHVDTLDIPLAPARCAEVARQELQEPEMGRYEVVDLLLTF
jgi:hypothetical protein